jgi:hypothetical protein
MGHRSSFKKPWTLSRKSEFMLGVGPSWVRLKQNGKVAGDFSFGQLANTVSVGSLNPAYERSFARGHQQSIGMSAGLLIGIP